jgi:hypothetical protein
MVINSVLNTRFHPDTISNRKNAIKILGQQYAAVVLARIRHIYIQFSR